MKRDEGGAVAPEPSRTSVAAAPRQHGHQLARDRVRVHVGRARITDLPRRTVRCRRACFEIGVGVTRILLRALRQPLRESRWKGLVRYLPYVTVDSGEPPLTARGWLKEREEESEIASTSTGRSAEGREDEGRHRNTAGFSHIAISLFACDGCPGGERMTTIRPFRSAPKRH